MDLKRIGIFRRVFQGIFTPINKIFFKKSNRIVLYSNWGFRDNVEYLFKFLVENNYNQRYEIICASNSFESIQLSDYQNVKYTKNKLLMLYYYLSSKYFFYCFGGIPIEPAKKQIVVNLWHGMPIKKIGYLEENVEHKRLNYFTYLLCYSSFFSDVLKKSFDVSEDKLMIANAPRNAPFIADGKKNIVGKSYIVWMPTYRSSKKLNSVNGSKNEILPLIKGKKELINLDTVLAANDKILFIKLHPLQDKTEVKGNYKNIVFIDDRWLKVQGTNLYEFLAASESLITDYSSISIDYVLLNKPIFYILDDLKAYEETRGLNYKLDEFLAGDVIKNYDELVKVFEGYQDDPTLRREKLYQFYDSPNHSSKYILDYVGIK